MAVDVDGVVGARQVITVQDGRLLLADGQVGHQDAFVISVSNHGYEIVEKEILNSKLKKPSHYC